ncbi:MAG: sensor histidine kinase [Pseudomonadales bacterium]
MTMLGGAYTPAKRAMMATLSTKLSLALIAIVVLVGLAVMQVSQSLMRAYYEELTQKLNANIAMYVTDSYALLQPGADVPNLKVIDTLAERAMVINPLVEVYLLDTRGRIIAPTARTEPLMHQRVPLQPIQQFIAGEVSFPLRNIDPRHQGVEKVFSASAVRSEGRLLGYLYVVLGGQVYDQLEDSLQNSYSRLLLLLAIAVISVAAIFVGVLVFHFLVRRLAWLSRRMQRFGSEHLAEPEHSATRGAQPRDEVELLSQSFEGMAQKIEQQFALLEKADHTRRELISSVSHDLRTPLATIQGYLETLLIKNAQLSEEQRLAFLQTAMRSSRRLGKLIGDLFELSKLETAQVKVEAECFSLTELAYDTVQAFELQATAKQVAITVRHPKTSALVCADISLIQRVFENLIRNAICHTPAGGQVCLSIEANAAQGLKVSILDSGCGIDPECLPHIFERFYSVPNAARSDESSGLGLAIVKRILELHRSDIAVTSQLNQGSCFYFSLPVAV